VKAVSLDGAWEFRRVGTRRWHPAQVPGSNFTDLMANGLLDDPFVGDNEATTAWVYESDWEYRRSLKVAPDLLACGLVLLECEGLDTLATVWINGCEVGQSDNMFMPHCFDAKTALRPGCNEIRIRFTSPGAYADKLNKTPSVMPLPFALPHGVLVRKAHCQFGWDWGPKLPPCGIWRPIRLVGYDTARLGDVHIRQHHRAGKVSVSAVVRAERFSRRPVKAELVLRHADGTTQSTTVELPPRRREVSLRLAVDNPQLWWPRGYGTQPLYSLSIRLLDDDGLELDRQDRRVGLRKLRLSRRKDRYGESFTFVVNGVDVFAKGANWIPADSFPTRITDAHYRFLVTSAAKANMNMLRVWGGGFYEDERFYDLCDELGILVWQDFMFACAVYRCDRQYEQNVRREAASNIRRLRHRACLALWCGNNEMEQGWVDWGWDKTLTRAAKRGYDRMFHKLLPALVATEDPDTAYWPSSPSSGQPFQAPNAEDRGDGHYWGVWHGREPFTAFRNHYYRFQSEFGFQSLPEIATVKSFANEPDWNLTSHVMESHQKNPVGNELIMRYLCQTLRVPKDFESLCYASQILQAEAIRYGVEHWRRNRHRVSGTLYWQLNDCWPVLSWSSIDSFGRWKALHYAARRFYAPVLLSAREDGTRVELHLTNDTLAPFVGRVRWRLVTLDGRRLAGAEKNLRAKAQANSLVASLDFAFQLDKVGPRRCVLLYELLDRQGRQLSSAMAGFVPPKHQELTDPGLRAELTDGVDRWYVTVRAEAVARCVEVRIRQADTILSDNYFDLPAAAERTVCYAKSPGDTLAGQRGRLVVRSLWDSF